MANPVSFKINVDASAFALELAEFAQAVAKFDRARGDFEVSTGVKVDVSVVVAMPSEVKGVTVSVNPATCVPVMPAAKAQDVAAEITEAARESLDFADAKREGMEPKVFEVGQRWKNKDGELVVITSINSALDYPIIGEHNEIEESYTIRGHYFGEGSPSTQDLVELISE